MNESLAPAASRASLNVERVSQRQQSSSTANKIDANNSDQTILIKQQ
jgi:hypothetical protein